MSLCYITSIKAILPGLSRKEASQKRFPLAPIITYVPYLILSTLSLVYIYNFSSQTAISINMIIIGIGHLIGLNLRLFGMVGQLCAGKNTISKYLIENYNAAVITNEEMEHIFIYDLGLKKQFIDLFGRKIFNEEGEIIKTKFYNAVSQKNQFEINLSIYQSMSLLYILFKRICYEKLINKRQFIFCEFELIFRSKLCMICFYPIVAVICDDNDVIVDRVMNKYHLNQEEGYEMFYNQINDERWFIWRSDYNIQNEGSIEELYKKVDIFMEKNFSLFWLFN